MFAKPKNSYLAAYQAYMVAFLSASTLLYVTKTPNKQPLQDQP